MLEEYIFKNRNKEYGAWQIRKKYRKTLLIGLSISVVLVFSIFFIPYMLHLKKEHTQAIPLPPKVVEATLTEIHIEPPKEEFPSEQKKEDIPIKTSQKSPDLMANTDTIVPDDTISAVDIKLEELVREPQNPRLNEEGVFSCNDGLSEFRSWFLQQFALPESLNNDQDIKIQIQFMVNRQGFIDKVLVNEAVSPLLFSSIEKTLKNSPRWKPCLYEGKPVNQKYILPVFILSSKTILEGDKYFKNLK